MCLETKEIAAPACSCLDSTILTWLCVAGLAFLLRLDEQGVSFRLPMPHAWMLAFARVLMSGLALLSDANVDAPTNASVAFDHFVGLLILTVCVETVGSRLCSSYIYFVSSQYVSDPINSIIFSCALLACETDPVTCRPHVWLGVAQR